MQFWRRVTIGMPVPILAELEHRYGPMQTRNNTGTDWTLGTLAVQYALVNYFCLSTEQTSRIGETMYPSWMDWRWWSMREHFDIRKSQDDADAAARAAAALTLPMITGALADPPADDVQERMLARRLRMISERVRMFPDPIQIAEAIIGDLVIERQQDRPRLRLVGGGAE